jgi:DNA (cytosine-5)-methyltransferase 1
MEEVPQYLRAMALRGRPVLAGVVENVIDIRDWTDWSRWRTEIEAVGYRTRLIALNSMHAQSVRTPRAPQSRDRLYLAYWHVSLGRDPDWDKWLRPAAWCPTCEEWVAAVQVFKDLSRDMGRYRSQYVYRCPRVACRRAVVEPAFLPAYTAIDWTLRGERIGDRARPLAPKTMARIAAGIRRYARPIHVEAMGHTYDATSPRHPQHGQPDGYVRAWPVEDPLKTLHTDPTKAVVVPPLLVPVEGRERLAARTAVQPLRGQTGRSETALVTVPPFIAELRGGGSVARPLSEALATVTASGNHHGLAAPDSGVRGLLAALPTQTTVEGDALITGAQLPAVEDCLFRMLEPDEILRGMAFARDYIVLGNRRERVRQGGNAVTPPAAEVIVSALVECITGESVAA